MELTSNIEIDSNGEQTGSCREDEGLNGAVEGLSRKQKKREKILMDMEHSVVIAQGGLMGAGRREYRGHKWW